MLRVSLESGVFCTTSRKVTTDEQKILTIPPRIPVSRRDSGMLMLSHSVPRTSNHKDSVPAQKCHPIARLP